MIYFKIKNVPIKHKGILAPMQEYTHLPFRLFCKQYNTGLTFTEMVNINHIIEYKDNLSKLSLLDSVKEESPCGVQLFGDFKNKKTIDAIKIIDEYKFFDIIDLNVGCPSPKVTGSNSGAYNLKQIDKILPIIKEAVEVTNKPITVKTRLGYSEKKIEDTFNKLIKTGISGISIHGRLATENYSMDARIEDVLKISNNSPIPILYNGDVSEKNYFKLTDFKGLMVAREALRNPFIFKQIDYFSKEGKLLEKENFKIQLNLFLKYLEKYPISFQKMKVSVIPFLKGEEGCAKFRDSISKSKTKEELIKILDKLIKQ